MAWMLPRASLYALVVFLACAGADARRTERAHLSGGGGSLSSAASSARAGNVYPKQTITLPNSPDPLYRLGSAPFESYALPSWVLLSGSPPSKITDHEGVCRAITPLAFSEAAKATPTGFAAPQPPAGGGALAVSAAGRASSQNSPRFPHTPTKKKRGFP